MPFSKGGLLGGELVSIRGRKLGLLRERGNNKLTFLKINSCPLSLNTLRERIFRSLAKKSNFEPTSFRCVSIREPERVSSSVNNKVIFFFVEKRVQKKF